MDIENNFDNKIENLIMHAVEDEHLNDITIERSLIVSNGGNYMSKLFNVELKGFVDGKSKKTCIFIKTAPTGDIERQILKIKSLYKNEIFFYTKLVNRYENLQQDFFVSNGERVQFAKCYGIIETEGSETILLENLKYQQFNIHDRLKPVTEQYMDELIKSLARFHALSFVLQKHDPKFYEKSIKHLKPVMFENYAKHIEEFYKNIFHSFEKILCKESWERLFRYCYSNEYKTYEIKQFSPKKRSVLCHGDYRSENILVKTFNNEILSVIPIDYQTIYYGSPLNDLWYLIFGATHTELRRKNFSRWIELYHSTMKTFLKCFDIDQEKDFPRNEFDDEIKETLPYGLIVAVKHLILFTVDVCDSSQIAVIFQDPTHLNEYVIKNNLFRERACGVVEDFLNLNYI